MQRNKEKNPKKQKNKELSRHATPDDASFYGEQQQTTKKGAAICVVRNAARSSLVLVPQKEERKIERRVGSCFGVKKKKRQSQGEMGGRRTKDTSPDKQRIMGEEGEERKTKKQRTMTMWWMCSCLLRLTEGESSFF